MKNIYLLYVFYSMSIFSFGQSIGDTIIVQTFDYSSNTRDTIASFPIDTNLTFEKIILSYNMRCKDNVVNTSGSVNNVGCGAWDYSCHTYIHDSTRVDSILTKTASHTISGFSGNNYNYSISPVYNYYQFIQQNTIVNAIITEDTSSVGSGNVSLSRVVGTDEKASKSQFLYKVNELLISGLINDSINAISLQVNSNTQVANFLKIKMKLTTDTILDRDTPHLTGFTEVYHKNTILTSGMNRFQFHTPFPWDSISNIIIEFSVTNSTQNLMAQTEIQGDTAFSDCYLYTNDANYIEVNGAEYIDIPHTPMNSINDEVTVSLWLNGDENTLPMNTYLLEAYDSNNNRTMNIHLPWSNGRIYWDCGNSGVSYDRIDKAANLSEYTGGWNHWAFTKNSTTGDMKVYHNGILWHSGTGYTNVIDIELFKLGSNASGSSTFWDGKLKDLQIFNSELSQNTIQSWMYNRIDASHPNYANLVAYYPFDEGSGNIANDNSSYSQIANFYGNILWRYDRGEDLEQFFISGNVRPNIEFYQGTYTLTTFIDTILDSLQASTNTIIEKSIIPNYGSLQDDSISTISNNVYWEAVSYTFDLNGNIISIDTTNIDGTISIMDLLYYKRYPMAFQIMSFVTPYGAGLDLGIDGKTWYFDVTDYTPVLKGNKRITMSGGGQWQEDMDIKFLFIIGTPPRNVLEMQQIWKPQSKGYTTIMSDDAFEPRSHTLLTNAISYKLRTSITGHGQEGEFIPRIHTLNLDDSNPPTYSWEVWTECADNPIYPQGGTWIYDRAGWCPGQATDLREDDITPFVAPGQTHIFDYGINGASGSSNYWVNCQLVSYDNPNFNLDASIVEILSPSTSIKHFRRNPMCSKPEIVLQNTGSSTLYSAVIKYWINGGQEHSYTWNGSLYFLEKVEIQLPSPASFWSALNISSENKFFAEVVEVNSLSDEYSYNNLITSDFEAAPSYPNTFALWMETNSGVVNSFTQESETSWKFLNSDNNVLFSSGTLYANTNYRDTLTFDNGCYTFIVEDTDDDGFDFWANNDGVGMARFREIGASWIHVFDGDFGKFIFYEFKVEDNTTSIEQENYNINIYPNPSRDYIIVRGDLFRFSEIAIVDNIGRTIMSKDVNKTLNYQKIETSLLAKGIYYINIDGGKIIKKIVKQ